eukprot:Blabericola_migrator_1__12271@NODE_766_length_6600_cov_283_938313_g513_i2_p9_GENE_NODE_766_length_6600_cov_283_938313_g513_i2NODE_766_length_6600_cov_283_938313_g513_i2_p9_ORF_typecomplete_len101_score5_25_NODE_766_length_6600_cov_283_938313_g513_i232073509
MLIFSDRRAVLAAEQITIFVKLSSIYLPGGGHAKADTRRPKSNVFRRRITPGLRFSSTGDPLPHNPYERRSLLFTNAVVNGCRKYCEDGLQSLMIQVGWG